MVLLLEGRDNKVWMDGETEVAKNLRHSNQGLPLVGYHETHHNDLALWEVFCSRMQGRVIPGAGAGAAVHSV